jgi:hypothetical protein
MFGTLGLCLSSWASDPTPVPDKTSSSKKPTAVVITNENLAEYAEKGHITAVTTRSGDSKTSPARPVPDVKWSRDSTAEDGSAESRVEAGEKDRRQYWRDQYMEQLRLIEAMEAQIEALDLEIPQLWRQFYALDDPMYRDGVIKPRLDQALEDRQRIEEDLTGARAEIPAIVEAARRDGAKPSWFRGLQKPTPKGEGRSETRNNDYSIKPSDMNTVSVVDADDTSNQ